MKWSFLSSASLCAAKSIWSGKHETERKEENFLTKGSRRHLRSTWLWHESSYFALPYYRTPNIVLLLTFSLIGFSYLFYVLHEVNTCSILIWIWKFWCLRRAHLALALENNACIESHILLWQLKRMPVYYDLPCRGLFRTCYRLLQKC